MQNPPKKRMSVAKKILFTVLAIPILFILFVLGTLATAPLFNNIDKGHFEKLNTQSSSLFEKIKAASNASEAWTYNASCEPQRSGWMPSGLYTCKTTIFAEVPATSSHQLSDIHNKYYPIISASPNLTPDGSLSQSPVNDFGKVFVVSSAEQRFISKIHNAITCSYLDKLVQPEDTSTVSYNQNYGSPIQSGGRILVRFQCSGTARENWYEASSVE